MTEENANLIRENSGREDVVRYFELYEDLVGKRVSAYGDFVWKDGGWRRDDKGMIRDRLAGYAPTEYSQYGRRRNDMPCGIR